MKIQSIKTRIFKEGDDLFQFITNYVPHLEEKSVLVITSKIVALAERRTVIASDVTTKEKVIREESEYAIQTKYVWLTIKDGMVMPSAGIDESNANGKMILLPKNSFDTARLLHRSLRKKYRIRNLGILITDSRTLPLRAGVIGVAMGYAGFRGIKDYRGTRDIFGRKFKYSRVDIADSLAAAAVLIMGEGNEQKPLAVIKNAPIQFSQRLHRKELHIEMADDMYGPLFKKIK